MKSKFAPKLVLNKYNFKINIVIYKLWKIINLGKSKGN